MIEIPFYVYLVRELVKGSRLKDRWVVHFYNLTESVYLIFNVLYEELC